MRGVHAEDCPNSTYYEILEPCKWYAFLHLSFFRDEILEAKSKKRQVCYVQRKFHYTSTQIEDNKQGFQSMDSGFLKFRIQYDKNHLDSDGQKDTWDTNPLEVLKPVELFQPYLRRFCPELNLNLLHLYHEEVKDWPNHGYAEKADVPEYAALWIA